MPHPRLLLRAAVLIAPGFARSALLVLGALLLLSSRACSALTWTGDTFDNSSNGVISPTEDLWINIYASPACAATQAMVVYSLDNGSTWKAAYMTYYRQIGMLDWWHADLGTMAGGSTIQYAVEVTDAAGNVQWDTNGGANYTVSVTGGPWAGNHSQTPSDGNADPYHDLVVTVQTYPQGSATSGTAYYTLQNSSGSIEGSTYTPVAMQKIGTSGQNDLWQADLGKFAGGATVIYEFAAQFGSDVLWDSNGGVGYTTTITGGAALQWAGNTAQSPANGNISAGQSITITSQSRPATAALSAQVITSTNNGATWTSVPMQRTGTVASGIAGVENDTWSANIGSFPAGASVTYAVGVTGTNGTLWDNNGGPNYTAFVNSIASPSDWVGNTATYPASGQVYPSTDLWINTETYPLGAATAVNAVYSVNSGTTWTTVPLSSNGTSGNDNAWHADLGKFPPKSSVIYYVRATFANGSNLSDTNSGANYTAAINSYLTIFWMGNTSTYPAYGSLNAGDSLWINTETETPGAAVSAAVVYSTNGGVTWNYVAMSANGSASDGNDAWHVNLGSFPEGTEIQYAVSASDANGNVTWDSNTGSNYRIDVNTIIRDLYTDKAHYNPGDTATITALLTNSTTTAVTGTLNLVIKQYENQIATSSTAIQLSPGQSATVTFPWTVPGDDFRGYGIDSTLMVSGSQRGARSTAVDVSSDWTKFPRYGFFSDYYPGEEQTDSQQKAFQLSEYHIDAVQFYDWAWYHNRLVPYNWDGSLQTDFTQDSGRAQSLTTIQNKIAACKSMNMFTMAYALMYGDTVDSNGPEHLPWAAFKVPYGTLPTQVQSHSAPETIWVMDVSNTNWQNYIYNQFADAIRTVGFEGIHLDNLGGAWNYQYDSDNGIPEWTAFPNFINGTRSFIRQVNPNARVIENDVYAGYINDVAPSSEDVYYAEVWGFNGYNDIRNLILDGQQAGNGKAVVLAAYVNYVAATVLPAGSAAPPPWPIYINDATAKLMDACCFANGGNHVELGEGDQMLSNVDWTFHSPAMHPALARAMRSYYDFNVRYENFLFYNTSGNLYDNTANMNIGSGTHALSRNATANTIWTVSKIWRDEYDAVSLINLNGVSNQWRGSQPNPTPQSNIQIKYYLDKKVNRVLAATPDDGLGDAVSLPFTEGTDSVGYYVTITVPSLQFWDLLIFDKTSKITMDGNFAEWTGTAPAEIHTTAVSNGEWIYTGQSNDYRTWNGATADSDITEVRVTSDDTYVYFLIRMSHISDPTIPAAGIALNTEATPDGTGFNWIGDETTPTGSIGLEQAAQYATNPDQIMLYNANNGQPGGWPTIKLYYGSQWADTLTQDSAIVISSTYSTVEARINKNDLGVVYPQRVTMTLASFRSSGSAAGVGSTYVCPDGNNNAIDIMGGDPGVSANAWTRDDLYKNQMRRYYQFVLDHAGAEAVWLGDQYCYPAAGSIDASDDFWVNESAWPSGAERSVYVEYSVNGGPWRQQQLSSNGQSGTEDLWHADLGRLPVGAQIQYYFQATDANGNTVTDANNNLDYSAQVNTTALASYGDGIADWWRLQYWGHADPEAGDHSRATDDADGTGMTNLQKYIAGLNPLDPHSRFFITSVSKQNGTCTITWSSVAGKTYQVLSAASAAGPYTPLSGTVRASAGSTSYQDQNASGARKFYEVVVSE